MSSEVRHDKGILAVFIFYLFPQIVVNILGYGAVIGLILVFLVGVYMTAAYPKQGGGYD